MKDFVDVSEAEVKKLEAAAAKCEEAFKETAEYFGEDPKDGKANSVIFIHSFQHTPFSLNQNYKQLL